MPDRHRQLALRYEGRSAAADSWEYVLAILRDVIAQLGLAQVAADLDVTASQLSHALSQRERHYFRAEWLLYCIERAPNDELLQAVADLRDCDVVVREPMDAAEELAALKAVLEEALGPDIRRGLYAKLKAQRARGR